MELFILDVECWSQRGQSVTSLEFFCRLLLRVASRLVLAAVSSRTTLFEHHPLPFGADRVTAAGAILPLRPDR